MSLICPRCGGPVPDREHVGMFPGATSRTDNQTEICSRCGWNEAVEQWQGWLIPQMSWLFPPGPES